MKEDDEDKEKCCCCGMFLIYPGIYLIAFHCLLQGAYGVGVVVTSSYKPANSAVNYTTIASSVCLIPTGIFLFWANLFDSRKGMRAVAILLTLFTIFTVVTSLLYLIIYIRFKANSFLDLLLLSTSYEWVSGKNVPFAAWHIIAISLVLLSAFWCYYCYIVWDYSKELKKRLLGQKPTGHFPPSKVNVR